MLELVLTVEATAAEAMEVVEVVEEEGADELELLRSGELRLGPLS